MTKILVVDDDESIRTSLGRFLSRRGFEVSLAKDAACGLGSFKDDPPDLVVLDIMMPGMNGYAACQRMKEVNPDVAIIFLSAKGDIVDKATGFGQGADDYVTKPFEMEELLMRVEAVLRRSAPRDEAGERVIVLDDLSIYPKQYLVMKNGEDVQLKSREFEILNLLAAYPGQVFTRHRIYEEVWGEELFSTEDVIAVYVRRIRARIEDDPKHPNHLITVWGVGYKLV